jgi:hypothetical protein
MVEGHPGVWSPIQRVLEIADCESFFVSSPRESMDQGLVISIISRT